jgi:AcrR family transcriptional regulator
MLDAAQALVLAEGAAQLTLDAVARRAGVSKGGLLYNFPSKEALVKAMLERLVTHNQNATAAITERLPDKPGRALKAYVMNSVRAIDDDDRVSAALLAAVASDPALLKPATNYFSQRFAKLSRDMPFEHAALVYLATEGLWMLELLKMLPFNERQRARIVRHLLKLADEGPDE